MELQSMSATACGQYDTRIRKTYIFRADNLIILAVFQETILMDTRAMGKSIATYNSLVWLYRHTHLRTNHTTQLIKVLCIDIGM
ncbi:hypothetical protein D3C79_1010350 [compost metagenome]